jgi:hypothetical protein
LWFLKLKIFKYRTSKNFMPYPKTYQILLKFLKNFKEDRSTGKFNRNLNLSLVFYKNLQNKLRSPVWAESVSYSRNTVEKKLLCMFKIVNKTNLVAQNTSIYPINKNLLKIDCNIDAFLCFTFFYWNNFYFLHQSDQSLFLIF